MSLSDRFISSGTAEAGHRILVVDDDSLIRSYLEVLLASLDYVVTATSDGQTALSLLRSDQHFDLMFTDIRLGGELSGEDLGRLAHDLRPDMGVLFTSGSIDPPDRSIERLAQFRGFLRKPYRKRELDDAIRSALAMQVG